MPDYVLKETSEFDGQPVELYRFTLGAQEWNYTSGDVELEYLAKTYLREDLEAEDIVQATDLSRTELLITAPRDLPLAQLFTKMLPPGTIDLTIFRRHLTDVGLETISMWSGVVIGATFKKDQSEFRCVPMLNLFTRLGVRRLFQISCNHMLYDPDTCRVDPDLYKSTGVVTVISGADLTSPMFAAQADGYYTAGFVRRPSNGDMRFIVGHTGQVANLWFPFEDMLAFEAIEGFAGCDHSDLTCLNKFNNLVNNGGWPLVPIKNPAAQKFA